MQTFKVSKCVYLFLKLFVIIPFSTIVYCEKKPPYISVPQCLLRCKDAHMMQMDSAEWSMDFAFPLLSLLRANGSHQIVRKRILEICELNDQLGKCLESCPKSVEKHILFYGMDPWREICSKLNEFATQFPCWQQNIDALIMACYMESHKLRESMEISTRNISINVIEMVCQDLNTLSICNVEEYGKHCGLKTTTLLSQLFRISRDSMSKMLKMKWNELPNECMRRVDYNNKSDSRHIFSSASGYSRLLLINTITTLFLRFILSILV